MIEKTCTVLAALAIGATLAGPVLAAGYSIVSGPGFEPGCYAPFPNSKFFQWPKKPPPYRIALVNGFIGNTWRIQMIKNAKVEGEDPAIKPLIRDFATISTGTDVAAQIAAIDNYINQGFDAIITDAVSPAGLNPVIRRANAAGVVLINIDNKADTDQILQITHDATEMGRIQGRWMVDNVMAGGTILEVRGLQGNAADRDRSKGFHEIVEGSGKKYKVIQAIGNWDDGAAQKATADAIAINGKFDGVAVQGGSAGTVQALIDAGHPFVPVAGEGENGFRALCAAHSKEGLRCLSVTAPPGISAVSIKAAIAALQGRILPQDIDLPLPVVKDPDFKEGVNFFPDLGDSFYPHNQFPTCGINQNAQDILKQSTN
jgi:ribose transport system substrate-binding protein